MNKVLTVLALSATVISGAAQARNDVLNLPLAGIIGTDKAKQALIDVPFYFAGQDHPAVSNNWGDISTNKKTNAVGKSDDEACQWVLLSAIKALQEAAKKRGYDAVVNIRSNYKNNEFSSATEFQCGAGNIMAGVALKGELVKF
ncbi:excinuclease ABC subunit A [Rheinheimera maricola]|uniref:Excinuclease ABC subunit A n=1 Tax=Rheinheimera maricola TaxID=2793282 RepID=A0ABS7XDE4_9GAMM|nr:excinuclease ABC subunit A [Rheinheimera maricola]MBZ9613080.1 excinuclease ABC subunit A [Rheinheimera maricola]